MGYQRIYRDFIADRKRVEPSLDGYVERHHIVPKSMGGSDDPANLINLTPEDHFFAHLLLAKAYGGKQWGGVFAMASMINQATESRKVFAARYMVGIARRRFAEYRSQQMTGQRREYRDRVATLFHDDGRKVEGSRTQIAEATGLNIASVSRLCNGRQGRSYNGWFADRTASDAALGSKRRNGIRASANVAGANRRKVHRQMCGTIYESVTVAGQASGTNTGNIARAIRNGGLAGGSGWAYCE